MRGGARRFNAANVAWVWSHVKRAARAAEGARPRCFSLARGSPETSGAGNIGFLTGSALPSARSGCAAALDDTEEGEPSALGPGGAAAEREDPEAAGAAEEGAGEPGGRGDAGSGPSEEGGGGAAKPKKEMDGASFFEVLRITALRWGAHASRPAAVLFCFLAGIVVVGLQRLTARWRGSSPRRVLAEVEGDSGGDIPLGGLVPLPGGLGHKRLTLEVSDESSPEQLHLFPASPCLLLLRWSRSLSSLPTAPPQRIAAVLAEMEGEPAFAPLVASLAGEDGSGGVEGLRRRIEVCLAASVWGGDEARQARAG